METFIYDENGLLCTIPEELSIGSVIYITSQSKIDVFCVYKKDYSIDMTQKINGVSKLNANLYVMKYPEDD